MSGKLRLENLKSRIASLHSPVSSLDALYDLWAPRYPPAPHNPLMRAEQAAMLTLLPDVRGAHALDLACGTGRYAHILRERGAASVIGMDFSPAMLARAQVSQRVRATMLRLPFAPRAFDVIVSGLAVGHADDLRAWMQEAARVLRPNGTLLYSDFHPSAAQVGMKRTFRADDGRTYSLPHHAHSLAAQHAAACEAGIQVVAVHEVRVGVELQEPFANSAAFYRRWHGTPVVLVISISNSPYAAPCHSERSEESRCSESEISRR